MNSFGIPRYFFRQNRTEKYSRTPARIKGSINQITRNVTEEVIGVELVLGAPAWAS